MRPILAGLRRDERGHQFRDLLPTMAPDSSAALEPLAT
jgi:hypothetical protein